MSWVPLDALLRADSESGEWDRYEPMPGPSTYRMRRSTHPAMRRKALELDRLSRAERHAYRSGAWLGRS